MKEEKEKMIRDQIEARGVTNSAILEAIRSVDRSLFVPEDIKYQAWEDSPLPIGKDQTISQPYIVAYMADKLQLGKDDKVLEIGTGCGYNAAVLAQLSKEVYSVEIIEWLADLAKENLAKTNIKNIHMKCGDGYQGWPEAAPFDAIMLTAAPPSIPETLKNQLKIGGRLLMPVGRIHQYLIIITRTEEDKFEEQKLIPVRFVRMTGGKKI